MTVGGVRQRRFTRRQVGALTAAGMAMLATSPPLVAGPDLDADLEARLRRDLQAMHPDGSGEKLGLLHFENRSDGQGLDLRVRVRLTSPAGLRQRAVGATGGDAELVYARLLARISETFAPL